MISINNIIRKHIPLQTKPFPENPVLHLHMNEPWLLVHSPLGEHGSFKHSLTSEKQRQKF
jgi:hypothetical protein